MPHPKSGYKNEAGKRVVGTTTVIGRFKDSGALLHWAFAQGKLAEQGVINNLYDKRDEAAENGTLAHDLFEAHINGNPTLEQGERSDAAWTAYQNAVEWLEMSRIEILDQEMQLVSEKYQFGGCPDALGRDPKGRIVLLDWKTSNGVYQDYLIQLAAYGLLLKECEGVTVEGFHLVRFAKDHGDFAHHYWQDLSDAEEMFIILRRAYEIDKILKKRV